MTAWLAVLRRLWPVVALLFVGLALWAYGHSRYRAGEAAGAEQVRTLWNADREAQARAVEAQAASVAKQIEHDRLAAEEVERGLREKIASADAAARDLARRLRDAKARPCSGSLPATPANPGQPTGSGGITPGDGTAEQAAYEKAVDDATADYFGACGRDAARVDGWEQWAKSVAR